MKVLYTHKLRIVGFFFALMFLFKLVAIQEYAHIEQHKQEQVHQDNCQVCHTIFQIGKYQAFETPDLLNWVYFEPYGKLPTSSTSYHFISEKEIPSSELCNRPPPPVS